MLNLFPSEVINNNVLHENGHVDTYRLAWRLVLPKSIKNKNSSYKNSLHSKNKTVCEYELKIWKNSDSINWSISCSISLFFSLFLFAFYWLLHWSRCSWVWQNYKLFSTFLMIARKFNHFIELPKNHSR